MPTPSPTLASPLSSLDADLAQVLAENYPPLKSYWPDLQTVSIPQALFLLLDNREAFYGGAAGGGKSAALLAAALQYVDVPGYRALILRRTYAQLSKGDALIPLSQEWLANTDAVWNEQKKMWTFPSGATLEFGHVQNEADKSDYQGAAYQFVGFDELTQFPETIYTYIAFSRQRRRVKMRDVGVPIRVRSTANPGGIGHLWVKKRFIDDRKPGVAFIPAKVIDNPGLDVNEYRESLGELDETLRQQLLDGDWGAFADAAFTLTDAHLVDEFPLEDAMQRFEAADYGLNGAPWCLWGVDYEGNLIAVDMLYEQNKLPSELAPLILEKRKIWGGGRAELIGLTVVNQPIDAYVDPSIWHRTGTVNRWGAPAVLADEFTDNGVPVKRANNDPRAGLIRLRELLKVDPEHPFPTWHPRRGEKGAPRIFFTPAVQQLIDELKAAPLQPIEKTDGGEKVDPEWESRNGHAVAMCRYAVMTRPAPSDEPDALPEDPKARWLYLLEQQKHKARYELT